MSLLDEFVVLFKLDANELRSGLESLTKKTDDFLSKLDGVDKGSAAAGGGLKKMIAEGAALAGISLSLGALVQGVRGTADAYFQLDLLAKQFRSTTDAVDTFIDASGLIGVSQDDAVSSLKSLDAQLQNVAMGMGRFTTKMFEGLGIEVKDATGKVKSTLDVMGELAEKMKDMDRGKQLQIMNRLGLDPKLLRLFNADMINLQKRMGEVDRASGFNLEMAVKRSKEFTAATKGLSLETNTLKMYMEKLSEKFAIASMPFFTKAIEGARDIIGSFIAFLMKHNKFAEGIFIAIGAAITYFVIPPAISAAIAIWAMIAPFLAVAAVVVAVAAAFALLYDDIMNFIEGNDSLIGQLLPTVLDFCRQISQAFSDVVDSVIESWDSIVAYIRWAVAEIGSIFGSIAGIMSSVWNLVVAYAGQAIGSIVGVFRSAGDSIMAIWNAVVSSIISAIKYVMGAIGKVSSAYDAVKTAFGFGEKTQEGIKAGKGTLGFRDETQEGIVAGKAAIGMASASPLNSQTSNSISNVTKGGKNTSVNVGKVEVHTQATDAVGISKAIGGTMQSQMRQAVSNFDDGVLI